MKNKCDRQVSNCWKRLLGVFWLISIVIWLLDQFPAFAVEMRVHRLGGDIETTIHKTRAVPHATNGSRCPRQLAMRRCPKERSMTVGLVPKLPVHAHSEPFSFLSHHLLSSRYKLRSERSGLPYVTHLHNLPGARAAYREPILRSDLDHQLHRLSWLPLQVLSFGELVIFLSCPISVYNVVASAFG